MLKTANTHIASVAEHTTDAVGVVAVINMKAFSTGFCGPAYGALPLLGFQQTIELPRSESVSTLARVVRMAFGLCVAVFLLIGGAVREVIPTPLVVASVLTGLTVHLVAMRCVLGLVELRKRLYALATRAPLRPGREVEWSSTWHDEYSSGVEYSYLCNTFYAREA